MSGILALLRTDGAPVEPRLAERLTGALTLRGPDEQRVWSSGHVAFGHALLRTTNESSHERQPLSLDGKIWIVADGRVDGRLDLLRALERDTERAAARAPDVELILLAYLRWGEACVDYLLGDFAFAIWDGPRHRLFCARDHMGVKPFYYAAVGEWLLISSTIECLRRHPQVSRKLHDPAIADFLLFGFNQDAETTSFHDIQRLPPAHTLTWSEDGLAKRRYWTLPIEEPLYLRRDRDYIDGYRDLVNQAVSDRLRTESVSVIMSGGLDSSGLAACSAELLGGPPNSPVSDPGARSPVHAFTFVFDALIPHSERKYAASVARHLGVPIHFYPMDDDAWRPDATAGAPEPCAVVENPDPELACYRDMTTHSRVAFYGEGPDNALLYEWKPHLSYLLRRHRVGRLVADICKHVVAHRRVPLLPTIPRMLRRHIAKIDVPPVFPAWIAPDLVDRLELRERWRRANLPTTSEHPVRPTAYASLLTAQWQWLFETLEPAYTGSALEIRHPYMDVRLLRFLLRVPALPWCRTKHIQREALRGFVPETVRRRPKSSLSGSPDYERFLRHGLPATRSLEALAVYGQRLEPSGPEDTATVGAYLRLVALSHWLSHDENRTTIRGEITVEKPTPPLTPAKKPYATPSFQVYGKLAHITASVGVMGGLDGMTGAGMTNSRA